MKKLVTSLCIVLTAGVCFAAEDGKRSSAEPAARTKAIVVEEIRAIDHVGGDRYALIVGIDDYQDENIPDLTTCQADAAAMYELLTDPARGGIKERNAYVLLGPKATTRNIKKYLEKLRQIPSKSTVFVYFSGHGAKAGDEAYWITYDSEIDSLAASGLPDREIQANRFPSRTQGMLPLRHP